MARWCRCSSVTVPVHTDSLLSRLATAPMECGIIPRIVSGQHTRAVRLKGRMFCCVAALEFCWKPADRSGDGAEIRCLRSLTCQQPSVRCRFPSEIVGLPSKTRRSRCQSASSRCKSARSRGKPAGFHRCGLFRDENTLETISHLLDFGAELPFLSAASQNSSAAGSSRSATRCAAVEKWNSRCGNGWNALENVKHGGDWPVHPDVVGWIPMGKR